MTRAPVHIYRGARVWARRPHPMPGTGHAGTRAHPHGADDHDETNPMFFPARIIA